MKDSWWLIISLALIIFSFSILSLSISGMVIGQTNSDGPSGWAAGPFGGGYDVIVISLLIAVTVVLLGTSIIYNTTKNKRNGFWIFKWRFYKRQKTSN
ncbi:MAG: hypothetical protein ABIF08_04215 [Nanoarchaeota archaeon]